MATTKNLAEAIRHRLASNKELAAAVDDERLNISVGSAIYEARTNAGLTQQQLADRVNMHQTAIARLENADYNRHSLKTLQRIAGALGARVRVVFVEQSATRRVVSVEEFPIDFSGWEAGSAPWQPRISTTGVEYHDRDAVA
ncbi:MAG: helix-turn-helix transcriptional regulator [Planctomycetes bacterium]|nr:helix-turn-helix transcriptional regulator [Planctomycetota bacterium]